MRQALIDAAIWIVKHGLDKTECSPQAIAAHVELLTKWEEEGKHIKEIREAIVQFEEAHGKKPKSLEEAFSGPQADNLIKPDTFYYHRELRIVPEAPRLRFDETKMSVKRRSEPFHLIMKPFFGLDDLLRYFDRVYPARRSEAQEKQHRGKFKYLLQQYTVDELLFAIDASIGVRHEEQKTPLKNAFELEEYIEEGRFLLRAKQNIHQLEGIDRPIKRRV